MPARADVVIEWAYQDNFFDAHWAYLLRFGDVIEEDGDGADLSPTHQRVVDGFDQFCTQLLDDYWKKYPKTSGTPIHRTQKWARIIPDAVFGSWGAWDSKLYHLYVEFKDYGFSPKGYYGIRSGPVDSLTTD